MFFSNPQYFLEMINKGFVPSLVTQDNAKALINTMNDFITYLYNNKFLPATSKVTMSGGWRSESYNKTVLNAAPNSLHIVGRAIDVSTTELALICEKHPHVLEMFGLYMESSLDSRDHTHLQNVPPHSGERIYRA